MSSMLSLCLLQVLCLWFLLDILSSWTRATMGAVGGASRPKEASQVHGRRRKGRQPACINNDLQCAEACADSCRWRGAFVFVHIAPSQAARPSEDSVARSLVAVHDPVRPQRARLSLQNQLATCALVAFEVFFFLSLRQVSLVELQRTPAASNARCTASCPLLGPPTSGAIFTSPEASRPVGI
ncbi:hypothetical protein BCV70DRAFT_9054 [Testicularia cyperi]|uniref:Secreted protein n=1 Tax=Testicularia cyperi TaxID=1882483 RepID=A0A317Y018_9BASI|nr:hypothetical protein BCV70DRAFT_9054 [Testicularia cyperi]